MSVGCRAAAAAAAAAAAVAAVAAGRHNKLLAINVAVKLFRRRLHHLKEWVNAQMLPMFGLECKFKYIQCFDTASFAHSAYTSTSQAAAGHRLNNESKNFVDAFQKKTRKKCDIRTIHEQKRWNVAMTPSAHVLG
jgi:hypothetical protein